MTRRRRRRRDDSGFSLLELVIAVGLLSVVFAAVAAGLAGSLKAVGVQKNRHRGVELATLGMEDLQRLDYNHLGLCPSTYDAGTQSFQTLSPVTLACTGSTVLSEPCGPTVGTVPKAAYTCTRLNRTYQVQRYVVWGDAAQTEKRLAVVVTWTDQGGSHAVSQQSSLRAPGSASVVGVAAPVFVSVTTSPSTIVLANDGTTAQTVTVSAVTNGLVATDTVTASVRTDPADASDPNKVVTLTSADGINWSGSIPAGGTTFGNGSQYLAFNLIRTSDLKAATAFSTSIVFCGRNGVSCGSSGLPTVNGVAPSSADIDPGGYLLASRTLTATTTNTVVGDTVIAVFTTYAGSVSTSLTTTNGTSWTGVISPASGYRFRAGPQFVYFTVIRDSDGSTGVDKEGPVTFG